MASPVNARDPFRRFSVLKQQIVTGIACRERLSTMGMASELREAPDAVARQAGALAAPLAELVARLRRRPPQVVVTCARGSSAHAATFAKHLIELYLGMPVAAAAPNIASVYRRPLRLEGPAVPRRLAIRAQRRSRRERGDGARRPAR